MLRLNSLHLPPLAPVSLTVETGQCLGLRGASGSGKTRLLRAIADLDPCEGRLWLDGRERHQLSGPAWRAQVGYLPAEPGWWAHTVAEHFACWPDQAANLAALNLPAGLGDAPISRLSTGERQRLALLRALARQPRALLLDEPTAGLDVENVAAVEALLASHRRQGLTMIWVSHDPAQLARVADVQWTLQQGRAQPCPISL
jgi:phosphate-transporting ATPase